MSVLNLSLLHLIARWDGVRRRGRDEDAGASMAEYAMLLAFVATVALITLASVGTVVKEKYQVAADMFK